MKINKSIYGLALAAPFALLQSAYAGQRPNIVFFLVDDLGGQNLLCLSVKKLIQITCVSKLLIWSVSPKWVL